METSVKRADEVTSLQFECTSNKPAFKLGEMVQATIRLTNLNSTPINLRKWWPPESSRSYGYSVANAIGETLQPLDGSVTAFPPEDWAGSCPRVVLLKSGQSYEIAVNLSEKFDLTHPGL